MADGGCRKDPARYKSSLLAAISETAEDVHPGSFLPSAIRLPPSQVHHHPRTFHHVTPSTPHNDIVNNETRKPIPHHSRWVTYFAPK